METLKSILFFVIILAILGLLGFWAFSTIQSGSEYVNEDKIKNLQKENEELKKEVASLTDELKDLRPEPIEEVADVVVEEPKLPAEKPKPDTTKPVVYKHQSLINELQKLIDDGVVMKLQSRGTRVGTVQEFLNIYNKTSNGIDNDFGASTKTAVMAFQKDQGLTADGEAGKTTFEKMIAWLKKE